MDVPGAAILSDESSANFIGENKIGEQQKFVAELCSFDNFTKCTNHGNQALFVMLLANEDLHLTTIVAHLRHNNVASQLLYVQCSDVIEHSVQNALVLTVAATVPHAAFNILSTVDEPKVCRVTINFLLVLFFFYWSYS